MPKEEVSSIIIKKNNDELVVIPLEKIMNFHLRNQSGDIIPVQGQFIKEDNLIFIRQQTHNIESKGHVSPPVQYTIFTGWLTMPAHTIGTRINPILGISTEQLSFTFNDVQEGGSKKSLLKKKRRKRTKRKRKTRKRKSKKKKT